MKKVKLLVKKGFALEKKHKLITYASLAFLSVSSFYMRKDLLATKVELAKVRTFSSNLITNMVIFNRNYENFPLPIWQKVKRGDEFIMQYVNPQYVLDFGHLFDYNQYSLFGKNNFEIFPKDIASNYFLNDVDVATTGQPMVIDEISVDSLGNPMILKVLKWRDIKENKDTLVYGIVKDIIKDE